MANHELDSNKSPPSVYFSVENNCARITAVRNYESFQPVRIYYGKRSSADFLLHNGFVPEYEDPGDTYKLKIGIYLRFFAVVLSRAHSKRLSCLSFLLYN